MSKPDNFYGQQAAICAREAADAVLPNLRETFLRSQAAWQILANRETAMQAARERRDAEKLVVID